MYCSDIIYIDILQFNGVGYREIVTIEGWDTNHFYLGADDAPKAWMSLPKPYKEDSEE